MTKKRYFFHKHMGRDVINDTLCYNWLKGEELEEHMNVQYTKYSALKKENEQLKKENNKIKSILLKKRKDLKHDYNCAVKAGMPTGGTIGELDTIEDILEEMGLKND